MTDGILLYYAKNLHSIGAINSATVADYIASLRIEVNLSDHYRKNIIELLCRFSKHNNNISFKDITRTDIITFWIHIVRQTTKTHFINRQELTTFLEVTSCDSSNGFIHDIEADKRSKPSAIENIPNSKERNNQSTNRQIYL
jgi:hypothetical protein